MGTNLRNNPIDRRRLSASDRQSYKPQQRAKAVARAKAYRGQLAMQNNQEQFRTEQKPGTGGFTQGLGIQQQRLRDIGTQNRRSAQLRSE